MVLDMLLQVKFNRPVNEDEDYISAGGFEMVMNGKAVEFDFERQEMYSDSDNPCIVVFALRRPLYTQYEDFKNATISDLKNISAINECYVFTGEPGESDLKVVSVESITFNVIMPKLCNISVKAEVIESFNSKSNFEPDIVRAAFTSVWDGNAITTPCDVNLKTKEIVHIEKSSIEVHGSCEREFVTINGEDFEAHGSHNLTNTEDEYWYDTDAAQFVGIDSWERPVYKLEDGRLIKDVDPRPQAEPELCFSSNNEFDGEPDYHVEMAVKLLPKRVTW